MALIKKFTDTLDDGISNAEWDRYDGTIKLETETYNTRFAQTPGFKRFNWLVFKAVVWIESGGPKVWKGKLVLDNKIWTSMPMQIGNAGDAGYPTLVGRKEATNIIMSEDLKQKLPTARTNPIVNIQAGMAYLVNRLSESEIQSVLDTKDTQQYEHPVVHGDTLSGIAEKFGTTVSVLEQLNPGVGVLHPGKMKLKYQKASMRRVITGWRELNAQNVMDYYNVRDRTYAEKITYALSLFPKLQRPKP